MSSLKAYLWTWLFGVQCAYYAEPLGLRHPKPIRPSSHCPIYMSVVCTVHSWCRCTDSSGGSLSKPEALTKHRCCNLMCFSPISSFDKSHQHASLNSSFVMHFDFANMQYALLKTFQFSNGCLLHFHLIYCVKMENTQTFFLVIWVYAFFTHSLFG